MPAGCRREGFDVETAIVYRTEPRARLAKVAEAALKDGTADGVLLYSRRSAAAFALALRAGGLAPLGKGVTCFCLSAACAEALAKVTEGDIRVAERPDQLALFALIEAEDRARALRRRSGIACCAVRSRSRDAIWQLFRPMIAGTLGTDGFGPA